MKYAVVALFIVAASALYIKAEKIEYVRAVPPDMSVESEEKEIEKVEYVRMAMITGYNTVAEQTDSTPCIPASGNNICGRKDVVACPSYLDLGTVVEIRGKRYVCEDRTHKRFDGRFDISCDKDFKCPAKVHGWSKVKIIKTYGISKD